MGDGIQDVRGDVIGGSVSGGGNIIGKEIKIEGSVIQHVENLTIDVQMLERSAWAMDYVNRNQLGHECRIRWADITEIRDVGTLREHLGKVEVLPEPKCVDIKGTLCPAQLLYTGWWERKEKESNVNIKWRDGLQEWLFKGFELWGPSWDVTRPTKDNPNPSLIAQLGDGDEVESLPVIIPPSLAAQVRNEFLVGEGGERKWVYEAKVKGLLCHRSHLSRPDLFADQKTTKTDLISLREWDAQWGEAFDYCILINETDENHSTKPHQRPRIDLYSGYIWKCIMPKAWYQEGKIPAINDVFFIWEHTDFSKPDAVAYNMDSLDNKEQYFKERFGEQLLLQKSSDLVRGDEPLFSTSDFYHKLFTQ